MKKTKTIFFAILAMALLSTNVQSKSRGGAFGEGAVVVSAGYGFGLAGAVWKTYEANTGYKFSAFGPIHGKFEYGVSDKIGIGLRGVLKIKLLINNDITN